MDNNLSQIAREKASGYMNQIGWTNETKRRALSVSFRSHTARDALVRQTETRIEAIENDFVSFLRELHRNHSEEARLAKLEVLKIVKSRLDHLSPLVRNNVVRIIRDVRQAPYL